MQHRCAQAGRVVRPWGVPEGLGASLSGWFCLFWVPCGLPLLLKTGLAVPLSPEPPLLSTPLVLPLQARVLLKLNRPVDVAERGLVFVQNFLPLLAAKEAAGQVKPWFKEVYKRRGRAVGHGSSLWEEFAGISRVVGHSRSPALHCTYVPGPGVPWFGKKWCRG